MAYNATLPLEQLAHFRGHEVFGASGSKLGKLEDIYIDDDSGLPEWLAVKSGHLRSKQHFVPLNDAIVEPDSDTLRVAYSKDVVDNAPEPERDGDGRLPPSQEQLLYEYYAARGYVPTSSPIDVPPTTATTEFAATDTAADDAMTRSEEEMIVGTARREAGRAHLRKWVETEHVTGTVPTRHEEVHLEREPITDANVDRALSGPALSEQDHEEVLYEEIPVVETKVVPKERVRMVKDESVRQDEVSADLRKERIEPEGDVRPDAG